MAKPDPVNELRAALQESEEAGEKLSKAAAGVFSSIREIKNIVAKFIEKQSFFDEKTRKAAEKAVWRKCLKLIRRAEWQQRYVIRYQKLLARSLKELQQMLPAQERASLQLQDFHSIINSYGHGMTTFISRRDGKLSDAVRSRSEDAAALAQEVIADNVTPLEAELTRIATYIGVNKKLFLIAVQKEHSLTIDVGTIIPPGPFAPRQILLDADFAGAVEAERIRQGKAYYDFNVRGELRIPRQVLKEMTQIPRWASQGLTARKFVDYLTGRLGATLLTVSPTPQEEDTVIRLWEMTPKGSRASEQEEDKFKASGDMEILVHALRNARRLPVLILSNDNDVIGVSRQLQDGLGKNRKNISVVSYTRGSLVQRV